MIKTLAAAVVAGIILSLLALYPQWNLRELRGEDYNGAFATYDLDEMAYASYLQALIDGRVRKNDPYTGRDHEPGSPQPESLFSIQFLTAYAAAGAARIVGISAAGAMPYISVISAFLTAIALFWVFFLVTGSRWLSLAGTIGVMVSGGLISGIGAVNSLYDGGTAYPFFPYLRRHIPSLSFPFLFAMIGCVWCGIRSIDLKRQTVWAVLAAACFAVLTFSYFYLWTSAAALLAILFALTLLPHDGRRESLRFLAILAGLCVIVLIPYAFLVSGRNPMMDKAQLLVETRSPDLFRSIEVVGYVLIAALAVLYWFLKLELRTVLFIAAMAAAPILAFNQQVITGRSLQPFHYEYYSINYVAALALFLTAAVLAKRLANEKMLTAAGLSAAAVCTAWGIFEAVETTRIWDDINIVRDEAKPVGLRLRELASGDIAAARRQTTFNAEPIQGDSQPTIAPQSVLWARHQHTFAGVADWEENRRRYYQMLYFQGRDADWLRTALTGCRDIEACMALFGWDRFNATLSSAARPLTLGEIDEEVEYFRAFRESFDAAHAYEPLLHYAVYRIDTDLPAEFLSRWYELGEPEVHGSYVLTPLTRR